jgi:hypothetical protein
MQSIYVVGYAMDISLTVLMQKMADYIKLFM